MVNNPMPKKPTPPTKAAIRSAGFALAFRTSPVLSFPAPALPYLPAWDTHASAALNAIVDFRSACRRWAAAGQVSEQELAAEYERLEAVGLAGWLDEILGVR